MKNIEVSSKTFVSMSDKEHQRLENIADVIRNQYGSMCPCCGETKRFTVSKNPFKITGIGLTFYATFYGVSSDWIPEKQRTKIINLKGLFQKSKHYKVDFYKCNTCGAEWQTPPFEY